MKNTNKKSGSITTDRKIFKRVCSVIIPLYFFSLFIAGMIISLLSHLFGL